MRIEGVAPVVPREGLNTGAGMREETHCLPGLAGLSLFGLF